MNKQVAAAALACLAAFNAHALNAGDLAFTSLNADEDGWSLVTFVDIAANTTLYFTDNEFVAGAFNTGESYHRWNSGATTIGAGTVIRFSSIDSATLLAASVGTLSREAVALSSNYGISTTADTVYAFQGASASAPATFITAISNATDGPLAGTGLVEGVNAIRLNSVATSASPDFGQYNGARSGLLSLNEYKPLVADVANWTVDTANGNFTATVPDTTAFAITAVPEPQSYALMLAGLFGIGVSVRNRTRR
ncbi:PEP-CTERM putative exosortase interaction domain-containing protein [Burkholderiales bacterium JOSHI_001]|nr:PEP-CTERM putative exosortase interaction domain-containing protein [Burkholderiales bacterium JOSHI_001]